MIIIDKFRRDAPAERLRIQTLRWRVAANRGTHMRADLIEREAFLRAIFADPDNDMPRLVFADWLDDQGESDWAELIRLQCEIANKQQSGETISRAKYNREHKLYRAVFPHIVVSGGLPARGIPDAPDSLRLDIASLEDEATQLREDSCTKFPWQYSAYSLQINNGQIITKEQLITLFNNPVTANVTHFNLSGREVQIPQDIAGIRMFDIEIKPVISRSMVEVLAKMKEVRRIRVLDLRNNDLGNDALWALARSPYLIRLERLYLSEGNRFRGRVWQQVRERFGQDIVE